MYLQLRRYKRTYNYGCTFRQKCRKDFRKMLRCLTFPSKSGNFSTRGELFKKLGFVRLAVHFLTVRSRFVWIPVFDCIALNCYYICQFLGVRSEFNSRCRLFGSRASLGLQALWSALIAPSPSLNILVIPLFSCVRSILRKDWKQWQLLKNTQKAMALIGNLGHI